VVRISYSASEGLAYLFSRSFRSLRSFSEAMIYLDKVSKIAHVFERILGLINKEVLRSSVAPACLRFPRLETLCLRQ